MGQDPNTSSHNDQETREGLFFLPVDSFLLLMQY